MDGIARVVIMVVITSCLFCAKEPTERGAAAGGQPPVACMYVVVDDAPWDTCLALPLVKAKLDSVFASAVERRLGNIVRNDFIRGIRDQELSGAGLPGTVQNLLPALAKRDMRRSRLRL